LAKKQREPKRLAEGQKTNFWIKMPVWLQERQKQKNCKNLILTSNKPL